MRNLLAKASQKNLAEKKLFRSPFNDGANVIKLHGAGESLALDDTRRWKFHMKNYHLESLRRLIVFLNEA